MTHEPQAGTISLKDAATLLMLEERSVRRVASEFNVPKPSRGRYMTVPLVQAYLKSLQNGRKGEERISAENRMRDARAKEIEARTARTMRDLVSIYEVEEVQDELVGALRAGMVGLGASVTRDPDMERKIDSAVDGVFARVHAWLIKARAALRQGGEVAEGDVLHQAEGNA